MSWFNKLERKFSKYAIPNLMFYIIILYALGFIVEMFYGDVYDAYLSLDFYYIFKGQVWRLITFIIQPPSTSFIFIVFVLYFYYLIGKVLENLWGAFRFNVYFFSGVILNILASLIIYLLWGYRFGMSTHYINLALFMAFAFEQPDMEVMLFFVIPIKIKWLAVLDGVIFAMTIIGGYAIPLLTVHGVTAAGNLWVNLYSAGLMTYPGYVTYAYANATAALVSMINFILFYYVAGIRNRTHKTSTQRNYEKALRTAKKAEADRNAGKKVSFNERFYNANSEKSTWRSANEPPKGNAGFNGAKHKCAVCGRTELDDASLTFRYCSKCNGNYEYCNEHLYTHIHVQ